MVLGEPGVGKSALLDELTGSAADQGMRVLRTVGLESESPLASGRHGGTSLPLRAPPDGGRHPGMMLALERA